MFAFSAFVPTARFAWLMAAMLGVGLDGDRILLPALLAGPLGKCFMPKRTEAAATGPELPKEPAKLAPAPA